MSDGQSDLRADLKFPYSDIRNGSARKLPFGLFSDKTGPRYLEITKELN